MDWISNQSVVQFIGPSKRKSSTNCGYCKTSGGADSDETDNDDVQEDPDEKKSVCLGLGAIRVYTEHVNVMVDRGIWGYRMTALDYQNLIDINWRRSGRYLYKPIMEETCCPLYTIRLDALKFKISRSQKRVLRNWHDFLKDGKKPAICGDVCKHEYQPGTSAPLKKEKVPPTPNLEKCRERKKKFIRRNQCFERLKNKGIDIDEYQNERKLKEKARQRTLESYFTPHEETFKHKLDVKIVRVGSSEFNESFDESFSIYVKYQQIVHQDKRCSRRGYHSFLVDTPFIPPTFAPEDGFPQEGTHHMQYLIDGQIVAVGVIDLLPRCLSSAYFYYDPDYAFLNLGTFSALKEIEFVRRISEARPDCYHYYMGYYVHKCRKMRYKGGFSPSELLDEHSHQWVPLPECQKMIEENDGKFTVFRPNAPPATTNSVWMCRPLRYHNSNSIGGSGHFEKLQMNAELAEQLSLFSKHFGDLASSVFVVV